MTERPKTDDGGRGARRNHATLKHALDALAEARGSEPGDDTTGWVRRVQAAARGLFDAMQEHEDVSEEEGGTLPELTSEKPGLMAERTRLEHEHTDMLHRAEEIEEDAERQLRFDDINVDLLRLQTSILHDILELHLLRTDSLMYEARFRMEGGEQG